LGKAELGGHECGVVFMVLPVLIIHVLVAAYKVSQGFMISLPVPEAYHLGGWLATCLANSLAGLLIDWLNARDGLKKPLSPKFLSRIP